MLEERRHIVNEEINRFYNERAKLMSQGSITKFTAGEIRRQSQSSQQMLTERLQTS